MKHNRLILVFLYASFSIALQAQSDNWTRLAGPAGGLINCSAQLDGIWYVSTGSGIFQSTDKGDHWTYLDWLPQTVNAVCMDIVPGEILVGATSPDFSSNNITYDRIILLYRSTDEGLSWTVDTIKYGPPGFSYLANIFRHRGALFAVVNDAILRSLDNGHTWTNTVNEDAYIEHEEQNDSIILLNTAFDGSRYSRDGGNSWLTLAPPPTGSSYTLTALGNGNTFIVMDRVEDAYRSIDFGTSWQNIGKPFGSAEMGGCRSFPDGKVAAVVRYPVQDEMLYTSSDDGQTWQKYSSIPSALAIDVMHDDDVYGVTTEIGIYKIDATSDSLFQSNSGLLASNVKSMVSYGNQFLAGNTGGIWSTIDHGANWNLALPQAETPGILDIKRTGDTICAVSATNFYYTTDAGVTWIAPFNTFWSPYPFYNYSAKLAVDGENLVVTAGSIYTSSDFGVTWNKNNNYTNTDGVLVENGKYFVLAYGQGIIRSTDKGINWNVVNANVSTQGNLYYVQNTIFAATFDGGLSYSKNSGQTWSKATGFPTFGPSNKEFIIGAMVANDSVIFAGVNYVGIYQSKDGGISWTPFSTTLPNPRFNHLLLKGGILYASCIDGGIWSYKLPTVVTHAPEQALALRIQPNPISDGDIQISWDERLPEPACIQIIDVLGRCVLTQSTQSNEGQTRISVTNLKSGIYRIVATSAGKTRSGTFVRR